MILGKQNETKKEVPQLLNLENALDFEDALWVLNNLWVVIHHKLQDVPKDHAKLVSYNKDSERCGTFY